MIPKLTLIAILFLVGIILTLIKRVREQSKQIRHLINQVYEQKSKKAKSKESEAKEERRSDDDTGGAAKRPTTTEST